MDKIVDLTQPRSILNYLHLILVFVFLYSLTHSGSRLPRYLHDLYRYSIIDSILSHSRRHVQAITLSYHDSPSQYISIARLTLYSDLIAPH